MSDADIQIYCRKYSCTMYARRCIERHNFMTARQTKGFQDFDPGCVDCAQVEENRALLEQYKSQPTKTTEEKQMPNEETVNAENVESKFCPRCEQDLPAEKFYKDRHRKSGLSSWCKECQRAAQAQRDREKRAAHEAQEAEKPENVAETQQVQVCTQCGQEKPLSEFHRDWKQGHKSACKVCRNQKYRVYDSKTAATNRISIDFSAHQGILKAIHDQARRELRNPDQQIIWLLAKQLERKVA